LKLKFIQTAAAAEYPERTLIEIQSMKFHQRVFKAKAAKQNENKRNSISCQSSNSSSLITG